MKGKWSVKRRTVVHANGQRRWDCAYQCILGWVDEIAQPVMENSAMDTYTEEQEHESRDLCPRLYPTATTSTND